MLDQKTSISVPSINKEEIIRFSVLQDTFHFLFPIELGGEGSAYEVDFYMEARIRMMLISLRPLCEFPRQNL